MSAYIAVAAIAIVAYALWLLTNGAALLAWLVRVALNTLIVGTWMR